MFFVPRNAEKPNAKHSEAEGEGVGLAFLGCD